MLRVQDVKGCDHILLRAIALIASTHTKIHQYSFFYSKILYRFEASASRLEAIATKVEAIAIRLEAIAMRLFWCVLFRDLFMSCPLFFCLLTLLLSFCFFVYPLFNLSPSL